MRLIETVHDLTQRIKDMSGNALVDELDKLHDQLGKAGLDDNADVAEEVLDRLTYLHQRVLALFGEEIADEVDAACEALLADDIELALDHIEYAIGSAHDDMYPEDLDDIRTDMSNRDAAERRSKFHVVK